MSAADGPPMSAHEVVADAPSTQPDDNDGQAASAPKRKALSPSPAPAEEPAQKRARVSEDGAPHGDAASATGGDDPSNGAQDDRPSANPESPVEPAPNRPRMPSAAPPDRRASVSQEEKKRGQRLFGGLIDTLSQTTGTSQQKRRLEIERRQQERAEHQKIEDDRRLAEKRAALDRERRIGQVRIDEQVMRLRHSTMLAMARCLQTKTAPKLCYLPWGRSEEDARLIESQIRDAEETIDREVGDFERNKDRRLAELGAPHQPTHSADCTVGEPPRADSNDAHLESDRQAAQHTHLHERDHPDERDDMVETAEDTVIY